MRPHWLFVSKQNLLARGESEFRHFQKERGKKKFNHFWKGAVVQLGLDLE